MILSVHRNLSILLITFLIVTQYSLPSFSHTMDETVKSQKDPNFKMETVHNLDDFFIHRTTSNLLTDEDEPNLPYEDLAHLYLDIWKIDSNGGKEKYQIKISYVSPNWFFIPEGESLILLVDGKRFGFSGEGGHNN